MSLNLAQVRAIREKSSPEVQTLCDSHEELRRAMSLQEALTRTRLEYIKELEQAIRYFYQENFAPASNPAAREDY